MADERMSEEEIADLATLADDSAGSLQAYLAHALRRAVAELRRERARADAAERRIAEAMAAIMGDDDVARIESEAAKREREACAAFVRGFQCGADPERIADLIDLERHHG